MARAPDFGRTARQAPTGRRARHWPWLAVPVLAALLVLQLVLADRARLAADPQWRPRLATVCGWLACSLPAWREPESFHVTAREARPHPSAPGVLLITATFRNDARFAQAWPQLQLSLANLQGDSLGLRRFPPREYLGSEPSTPLVEPGQSATITLEIVDPGRRAVAFDFRFL